ncbi:FUSC family protein [Vagococcus intermedius]|uniref:FUSC family protein n=1 Tax=Vagococcus intermedius TaxID=2991418 RepID=A0AAF0CT85_9ENTE|nr:FUSC family protein [Vagococcus intermedius]WEG72471.1 FUSC family protein [Vagococcus intermedius]WEG74558.1 FUSC family protein [Vagococcus intermedius]
MKEINRTTMKNNFFMIAKIILFITAITFIFTKQETLDAVAVVTGFLMFSYSPLPFKYKHATTFLALSFPLIGFLTFLASLNIWFGLLINLIGIFFVTLLTSQPFNYKLFMPFILLVIFSNSGIYSGIILSVRMVFLLISGIVIATIYKKKHPNTVDKPSLATCLIANFKKVEIRKFSIKLTLALTTALFISQYFQLERGMWLCMTVLSVTQLTQNDMKRRIGERALATIIGCAVYFLLFHLLVPSDYTIILTFSLAYIYQFLDTYLLQTTFNTMNALSATSLMWPTTIAIETRVLFLLAGILLVLIVYLIIELPKWERLQKLTN